MADDNKNLAGEGERTSILPQAEPQVTDQTEVLPTHMSQAETSQMPPVAQEQTNNAFAGTPLESVAGASADDQVGDEAVAASAATGVPASKKTSWGKRAAIAGAAAVLSVGFGAGIITHEAVMGDGQDFYEQGYEDGYNDQGDGDEDGDFGPGGQQQPGNGQQQGPGNGQQQGPGNGQQGPGHGQQQGPGSQQGDSGSTRPGPPPEGGRGPGSKSGSQGSADTSTQNEGATAS